MRSYGFTLLITAALFAGTARAEGSGQKPGTEFRTVVPVTPLPKPNVATPAAPEVRPKANSKTSAASKSKGGKAGVGRTRKGKARVDFQNEINLHFDGEVGLEDELYGKIEPTVESEKPAPAPAATTAKPNGTTTVPPTLTVRKPRVPPSSAHQDILYYRVRNGDTLDRIARRLRASGLEVTTADLIRVNRDRLSDANAIRAGDVLVVPLRQRGSPSRRTDSIPLK